MRTSIQLAAVLVLALAFPTGEAAGQVWDEVEHSFAQNGDVRIHYASIGEGPPVVMIHGFPDYWYSWRHQMDGLKDRFRVVAIDQRGYNRSSQPSGVEQYDLSLLVEDVVAVIEDLGHGKATVVGHDWGALVAWNLAFRRPDIVRNLVILNLPHPTGLRRVWTGNREAVDDLAYARALREGSPSDPDVLFGGPMTPETLSGWVQDPDARAKYIEAFKRSDFNGMLNYYKRNFPDVWSEDGPSESLLPVEPPTLEIPTLIFHGLKDEALPADGLNNTWDWIDRDLTIVTVPEAGHFVQQDAAGLVTKTMRQWLLMRH